MKGNAVQSQRNNAPLCMRVSVVVEVRVQHPEDIAAGKRLVTENEQLLIHRELGEHTVQAHLEDNLEVGPGEGVQVGAVVKQAMEVAKEDQVATVKVFQDRSVAAPLNNNARMFQGSSVAQ